LLLPNNKNVVFKTYDNTRINTGWAKSRYTVIILYTIIYCMPTFGPPCIWQRY